MMPTTTRTTNSTTTCPRPSTKNKSNHNNNKSNNSGAVVLSLQDYVTFQYMLSPPWIATKIVNEQVVTCTFYIIKTKDKNNTKSLHELVNRPHGITMLDYYLCCLCVLPSHILGMSQWISSSESDLESSASSPTKTTSESTSSSYLSLLEDKIMSKRKVLRKFHYSYYCGMFHVTTYHLAQTNDNDENTAKNNTKFHLVEFFDFIPRYYYGIWLLYMFVISFYIGIVALLTLSYFVLLVDENK